MSVNPSGYACGDLGKIAGDGVSESANIDYRKIFFGKHSKLEGEVIVHHSVEQQVLRRYPGLFTKEEMNDYEMLRGIPKDVNNDIHLSKIRKEWNNFMGWQGDELLTTYPCFIVTESLQNDIILNGLTGIKFNNIAMTFSDEFYDLCGNIKVPKFVQIICNNLYENNVENLLYDFYLNKYDDIIVSENALNVLKQHKIDMCDIEKVV